MFLSVRLGCNACYSRESKIAFAANIRQQGTLDVGRVGTYGMLPLIVPKYEGFGKDVT